MPYAVVASGEHELRALRGLLAARAGQLALRHGDVWFVPTGEPRVTAVRRHHAGQSVLCVTSESDLPVTVHLPARGTESELVEIATDDPVEPSGAWPTATVRPSSGAFPVTLDPGRTRWFRVRDTPVPQPPPAGRPGPRTG
ncbi:hypothetical protein GUY61_23970 [Streptomyces sp. GC420]|nr:hypothetical protein [Streptomyces sp. GC420]